MNPRRSFHILLVVLISALAGCSWITEFVILNTSSGDLTVTYTVNGKSCPGGSFIIIPATKTITELKKEQGVWKNMTPSEYSCNPSTMSVTTTLPPQAALRVAEQGNFRGLRNYEDENFDVLRLELKGTDGTVSLSGLKVLKSFTRESNALYVFSY